MMLAVFELPLSFLLTISLFRLLSFKEKRRYFDNVIYASCTEALILYVIIEALSFFEKIDYSHLACAWAIVCALLIIANGLVIVNEKMSFVDVIKKVWHPFWNIARNGFAILIGVFSCVVIAMAIIIPTSNYDSMVYHCARVAHWAQNHSVSHFATSAVEQIGSPIFAEYINLNVYVLMCKHDNFFNLLQTFSFLYSGYIVKKISEKLGAKRLYQNLAMCIFYATPIAFAESMTTQVDNVVTVFGLSFIYLIIDFWNVNLTCLKQAEYKKKIVAIFVFVGLGYITKPSVCFAMAVALVGMIVQFVIKKEKFIDVLKVVVVGGLICIVIALPYLGRNYITFGSLSPEEVGARQLVGTLNPLYLFVNFQKNFSMNLIQRLTLNSRAYLEYFVYAIAALLHVNANADSISEAGGAFDLEKNNPYIPYNDTATNPLVFYCFLFSIVVYLFVLVKNRAATKVVSRYGRTVIISTCALFVFLRWENYVTRYEIFYLALMCPFIAAVIDTAFEHKEKYKSAIVAVISCFIVADMALLFEFHWDYVKRALENREAGYFFAWEDIYPAREHAVKVIKENGYSNLGYYNSGNDVEYTIWTMLRDYDVRIENINISNSSSRYIDNSFSPDCILYTLPTDETEIEYNGKQYKLIFTDGDRTKLYATE